MITAAPAIRRLLQRVAGGFGALLAALAAAWLMALGTAPAPALAARHPNIIVVLTDDQDTASTSVMHNVNRKLAGHGVTFDNFFATFPLCAPSRATYLTGRYAHNTGVVANQSPNGFKAFDPSATVAVALQQAGYLTAFIGKYLNGYNPYGREHPEDIPPGFTRWFGTLNDTLYNWLADDQGQVREFHGSGEYQTLVHKRVATGFVRHAAASGHPFFMTVATHAPHGEVGVDGWPNPRPEPQDEGAFDDAPLPTPPSFNEANVSDKPVFLRAPLLDSDALADLLNRYRSRLASLLSVDRLVGRLVDQLKKSHALRNTWILFTSDNGYMLGEHRMIGKTKLYEESAKVPMIIRGPGHEIPHGVVRSQITGNIDLAPTILDIAGVDPLADVDGISLLPLAASAQRQRDRDILLESLFSQGVRAPGWMYAEHDPNHHGSPTSFELYDLNKDPHELRNSYAASQDGAHHPDLAAERIRLEARLDQLRNCAGPVGPDRCR